MTIKKVHGKLSDVKKAVGIGELLPTARNGSAAAVGRAWRWNNLSWFDSRRMMEGDDD
jgi:hypothetical protein